MSNEGDPVNSEERDDEARLAPLVAVMAEIRTRYDQERDRLFYAQRAEENAAVAAFKATLAADN